MLTNAACLPIHMIRVGLFVCVRFVFVIGSSIMYVLPKDSLCRVFRGARCMTRYRIGRTERRKNGSGTGYLLGIRVNHCKAVVQVLAKGLWVLPCLLPLLDDIQYVFLIWFMLLSQNRMARATDMAGVSILLCQPPCGGIHNVFSTLSLLFDIAYNLNGRRRDVKLVGTKTAGWIILARKIMGEGARSELGGRAVGSGRVALVGCEACGSIAVGVLTAMQDLGHVAVKGQRCI
jgi:hypothetical protein